jgi:transposase
MSKQRELDKLSHTELIKLVLEQTKIIEQLRQELERLKRQTHRSAAPFSRNTKKTNPARSGRKAGQGVFTHKPAPKAEEISHIIRVPLEQTQCPACHGLLEIQEPRRAWITELPEVQPIVLEYQLEQKTCSQCKKTYQVQCEVITADQVGCTAHRLSPKILALAHTLQYEHGIPARKVPRVLKLTMGLMVTQSAITQSAVKHSQSNHSVGGAYQALRDEVQHASVVHTDDTSWRKGGESAQLMVFKTPISVVYQVRDQHRALEVLEVIPSDFAGVLVTDRFKSYDAKVLSQVKQQKCVSHILKNTRVMLETVKGRARDFPLRVRRVFKRALRLRTKRDQGLLSETDFLRGRRGLGRELSKLLQARASPLTKVNERLRRELEKHHVRGSLLRFLEDELVPATNNAAERALRPAVVFRKLSAGSKSESGARAFEALKSVVESAKLNGSSGYARLCALYSTPR